MRLPQPNIWQRIIGKGVFHSHGSRSTELPPLKAYELWGPTYDDSTNNPLLFAEEKALPPMLNELQLEHQTILDAACGTGRYLSRLGSAQSLVGVDFSTNMLKRAIERSSLFHNLQLCRARIEELPFKSNSFDIVLCTLAIDHVHDLPHTIGELSRVVRRDGILILSSFHPIGKSLGWMRTFESPDEDGKPRTYSVEYVAHKRADYFDAFKQSRLQVLEVKEPPIDDNLRPHYVRAGRLDLYEQFKGHPLLLIFKLKKR